jgi:hypothetical protein
MNFSETSHEQAIDRYLATIRDATKNRIPKAELDQYLHEIREHALDGGYPSEQLEYVIGEPDILATEMVRVYLSHPPEDFVWLRHMSRTTVMSVLYFSTATLLCLIPCFVSLYAPANWSAKDFAWLEGPLPRSLPRFLSIPTTESLALLALSILTPVFIVPWMRAHLGHLNVTQVCLGMIPGLLTTGLLTMAIPHFYSAQLLLILQVCLWLPLTALLTGWKSHARNANPIEKP